jgi:DNA-binding NarL/FixJ family response regulator
MKKDIRVLIIEDDPYALDLMSLLLTRDWRTRVIAELDSKEAFADYIRTEDPKLDVVILDTEMPGAPNLPSELAAMTQRLSASPAILYTCTRPCSIPLEQTLSVGYGGYVLKQELRYALASAVASIKDGHCVITPGVKALAGDAPFPPGTRVLDGRRQWSIFTPREREVLRLAIIFNLAVRDMADELVLSSGWVSEIVSEIYKKLGVRDILSGEAPLEDFFTDETVLAHCRQITARAKPGNRKSRKAPWMSTLAFHLLTMPEIEIL